MSMFITYPAHRRDTGNETFSHVPLDVVFLCISHATMSEYLPPFRFDAQFSQSVGAYGSFTGGESSLSSKIFGRVASYTNCVRRHVGVFVARVVNHGSMVRCKLGSFKIHVCRGKRMLDTLVLPNGSPEDCTLLRVLRSFLQCGVAQTQCLSSEQTALSIHSVKNLAAVSSHTPITDLGFLHTILKPCPSSPINVSAGTW